MVTTSTLQREKHRPRGGKAAQGHTAGRRRGWREIQGLWLQLPSPLLCTTMGLAPRSPCLCHSESGPGWDSLSSPSPGLVPLPGTLPSLSRPHDPPHALGLSLSVTASGRSCHCSGSLKPLRVDGLTGPCLPHQGSDDTSSAARSQLECPPSEGRS